MFKRIYITLIVVFFSAFFSETKAQELKIDSIDNQLRNYNKQQSPSILFVHFDKNVYSNNDEVWFSAYLIKAATNLTDYNTLFVSLVNNTDSAIVLQRKFLINKGLAYGNFKLPDSIFSGNYRFVVNTNIKYNNKPDVEFVQPISIKSSIVNPLQPIISNFKTYDVKTREGTVLLKATSSDNRFVEGAEVRYQIGNKNEIIKRGIAKTSVIGEVMISYPADKITENNNQLNVSVKAKNKVKYLKFNLPYTKKPKYQVNFYPEGGYTVNDINSKIGFEIKDSENAAVKAKAVLYKDDAIIDTISSNSIGIGQFFLTPEAGKNYTVKIIDTGKNAEVFPLPRQLTEGVTIKIRSALANNELLAQIESNKVTKVLVIVHNYKDILLSAPINLDLQQPKKLRMDLTELPKGLKVLTILDSFYRPLAERIFFAHYDEINQIDIQTDKNEYNTREKVNLELKTIGKKDSIYPGLVSVACVQDNRILSKNKQDINSYLYFENDLGNLPNIPSGLKFNNADYLESIMLIKGWRKYKWPLENQKQIDINKVSSTGFSGVITKYDKPLKKPMAVITFGGSKLNFLSSDSIGRFTMNYEEVLTNQSTGRVWLNLGDKNYSAYKVAVNDPVDELKDYLKSQVFKENIDKSVSVFSSSGNISSGGITLKEVTIRKTNDPFYNLGPNRCGDYVCQYNILNCPNHPGSAGNHAPVKGKTYKNGPSGGTIVYQGCEEGQFANNLMLINGINLPKDFYISDINNKEEPINFATVYWQYQLHLNKGTTTPLSFNTGDLVGKFKIIIQGLTENGVAYGEKDIEIKRP